MARVCAGAPIGSIITGLTGLELRGAGPFAPGIIATAAPGWTASHAQDSNPPSIEG